MVKHTYTVAGEKVTKELTALKAIRAKCLDCSAGSASEVKNCSVTECPNFPFRFGKSPGHKNSGNADLKNRAKNLSDFKAAKGKAGGKSQRGSAVKTQCKNSSDSSLNGKPVPHVGGE